MTAAWPVYDEAKNFPEDERLIGEYIELVKGIRNVRMEMNVPNKKKTELFIVGKDASANEDFRTLQKTLGDMNRMVFASDIRIQDTTEGIGEDAVTVVTSRATAYIPLNELVDREKEIERLTQENKKMDKEIARSNGMLNNPNFVSKAPAAKVEEERKKLAKYQAMKQQIEEQLERYKA